ncbi:TrkA C-terminal domain-containing protein [Shewanella halotolerans]|uniref:aspartate-alanine antiporter-like transporter n=1 Tax=Shewanella halotolerans TaxID=2864204 RepID=UPI001C656BF9|nr:TrkA C-terminal domain-containing protein [Shewanella halotolerans]QYJ89742.1 hypothetical protein K0H81_18590 [Shewanella halotolerans]
METLHDILHLSPYLPILIALVSGLLVGKIGFGRFRLGSIVGTLAMGILIGQMGAEITPSIRWLFFAIFMYLVGYQGGYHLIKTLKLRGKAILLASVAISMIAIITLAIASWLFDLNIFLVIGMTAGSFVHPEIISEASELIGLLPGLDEAAKQVAQNQVNLGYMLTVILGVLVPVALLTWLLPAAMPRAMAYAGIHKAIDTRTSIVRRVFKVNVDSTVVGKTLAQLNAPSVDIIFERSRAATGGPHPKDEQIVAGDIITVTGCHNALFYFGDNLLGTELPSSASAELGEENCLIVIHAPALVGRSLQQVKMALNERTHREVCITAVSRDELTLEVTPELELKSGDILQLTGSSRDIQTVTQGLKSGLPRQGGNQALFGLGLVAAYLVSLWHLELGSLYLYFGTGLTSLLSGIAVGWACHKNNPLERLPQHTSKYLRNLSLLAFTAVTGLYFGPHMIEAMQAGGIRVVVIGGALVLISQLLSFAFAYRIFNIKQPAEFTRADSQHPGLEIAALYRQQARDGTLYALLISYVTSSALMLMLVYAVLHLL